jgi:hypothetical protein
MSRLKKQRKLKKQRTKMFAENPHCYWCGKELVLWEGDSGKMPDNGATIDHLYSRLHPLRLKKTGDLRRVLSCRWCNNERSREETKVLYNDKHRKKSGNKPLSSFGYLERKRRLAILKMRVERSDIGGLIGVMGKPMKTKQILEIKDRYASASAVFA